MLFPHVDRSKQTTVLVDLSVFLHRLDQCLPTIDHKGDRFRSVLAANLVYSASCLWLPPEIRETVTDVIYTQDVKIDDKYWRHDWLSDPANYLMVERQGRTNDKLEALRLRCLEDPRIDSSILRIHYKTGRALPTYRFQKIKRTVRELLAELRLNTLEAAYFESDDIQAALVRKYGSTRNTILNTVDTDLMGLINPNTTWACMTGFKPAVRDNLEGCSKWTETRLKRSLVTWSDIWQIKGELGDKSDNLPKSKGVLLPVIDLHNPPPEYLLRAVDLKKHRFMSYMPLEEGLKAAKYLKRTGTNPVTYDHNRTQTEDLMIA